MSTVAMAEVCALKASPTCKKHPLSGLRPSCSCFTVSHHCFLFPMTLCISGRLDTPTAYNGAPLGDNSSPAVGSVHGVMVGCHATTGCHGIRGWCPSYILKTRDALSEHVHCIHSHEGRNNKTIMLS